MVSSTLSATVMAMMNSCKHPAIGWSWLSPPFKLLLSLVGTPPTASSRRCSSYPPPSCVKEAILLEQNQVQNYPLCMPNFPPIDATALPECR